MVERLIEQMREQGCASGEGGEGCEGGEGGEGCNASLCNTLQACTSLRIRNAMFGLPLPVIPFKHAVSAINAAIARENKKDRVVILDFAAKVYAVLAPSQRQRLDDPKQWTANDNVVMNWMFVIITHMNAWKKEYGM